MPKTSTFPTRLDSFVEVPTNGLKEAANFVMADHINHIASAASAVQRKAVNVVLTDFGNRAATLRRNILFDTKDYALPLLGDLVTAYSWPPSGWKAYTVDEFVTPSYNKTLRLPVWNDPNYAIIIRGVCTYTTTWTTRKVQVPGNVVSISPDGTTAKIRFTLPSKATTLRYEIICVDKSNYAGIVELEDEDLLNYQQYNTNIKHPHVPVLYVPPPYSSNYPEPLKSQGYWTWGYRYTEVASTDAYVGETYIQSKVGRIGNNEWTSGNVACSGGDFGFIWPDVGYPFAQMIDLHTESWISSATTYDLDFYYRMFYPTRRADYAQPCYMRIYVHAYDDTLLAFPTTATPANLWTTSQVMTSTPTWSLTGTAGRGFIELPAFAYGQNTTWTNYTKRMTVPANTRYIRVTVGAFNKTTTGDSPGTWLGLDSITFKRVT